MLVGFERAHLTWDLRHGPRDACWPELGKLLDRWPENAKFDCQGMKHHHRLKTMAGFTCLSQTMDVFPVTISLWGASPIQCVSCLIGLRKCKKSLPNAIQIDHTLRRKMWLIQPAVETRFSI